jgi:hypothetical protein
LAWETGKLNSIICNCFKSSDRDSAMLTQHQTEVFRCQPTAQLGKKANAKLPNMNDSIPLKSSDSRTWSPWPTGCCEFSSIERGAQCPWWPQVDTG